MITNYFKMHDNQLHINTIKHERIVFFSSLSSNLELYTLCLRIWLTMSAAFVRRFQLHLRTNYSLVIDFHTALLKEVPHPYKNCFSTKYVHTVILFTVKVFTYCICQHSKNIS